jgi:hypothetical protein
MDDLARAYAATVVEIVEVDGTHWLLRPTGADHHGWDAEPAPTLARADEAWVVTAHNPFSQPLPPAANATRAVAMLAEVERAGLPWLAAEGRSPDGGWSEAGLLLPGAPRAAVLALARSFDQNAVFHWTPTTWSVVGVHLAVDWTQGWRCGRSAPANGVIPGLNR